MVRDTHGIRLLLVEDDPLDARCIRTMLTGIECSHVTIGRHVTLLADALRAPESERFDAVLLDLNLPDSFGLDTFEKMRGIAQEIPIVIQTGLRDLDLAQMAMEGGALDYLVKGEFDAQLLSRTLQFAVRNHALQVDLRNSRKSLKDTQNELQTLREETGNGDD